MRANYIHIEKQLHQALSLPEKDLCVAEIGVWHATTFMPMAELCRQRGVTIHAVDSFAGMAQSTEHDGNMFPKGALSVGGPAIFDRLTLGFTNIVKHHGWVPDILSEMEDVRFSFVHLDVDQYKPTMEALYFLLPRMASAGCIACHDWFPEDDKLAAKAIKEFLSAHPDLNYTEQVDTHHIFIKT